MRTSQIQAPQFCTELMTSYHRSAKHAEQLTWRDQAAHLNRSPHALLLACTRGLRQQYCCSGWHPGQAARIKSSQVRSYILCPAGALPCA